MSLYGMGQQPFSDTMGYLLAQKYLVDHNDTSSPIAIVKDGTVVGSYAMHDMGAYDRTLRRVFLEVFRAHPWLVARSFAYEKPLTQLRLLSHSAIFDKVMFFVCLALAGAAGVLTWSFDESVLTNNQLIRTCSIICAGGLFSLSTVFIMPNIDLPDTVLSFLIIITTAVACTPLLIRTWSRRQVAFDSYLLDRSARRHDTT
jgi:hypothetical protein